MKRNGAARRNTGGGKRKGSFEGFARSAEAFMRYLAQLDLTGDPDPSPDNWEVQDLDEVNVAVIPQPSETDAGHEEMATNDWTVSVNEEDQNKAAESKEGSNCDELNPTINYSSSANAEGSSQNVGKGISKRGNNRVVGKPRIPPQSRQRLETTRSQKKGAKVNTPRSIAQVDSSPHHKTTTAPLSSNGSSETAHQPSQGPSTMRIGHGRKRTAFQRAQSLFIEKKAMGEINKTEREARRREQGEKRLEDVERRRDNFKMYNRKTRFGQPIMATRMTKLLDKIRSSSSESENMKK